MEFPERKNTQLKSYDYSQNNICFITVCTHNRAKLFGEIAGATLPEIIGRFKTTTTNEYTKGVKSGVYKPFEIFSENNK